METSTTSRSVRAERITAIDWDSSSSVSTKRDFEALTLQQQTDLLAHLGERFAGILPFLERALVALAGPSSANPASPILSSATARGLGHEYVARLLEGVQSSGKGGVLFWRRNAADIQRAVRSMAPLVAALADDARGPERKELKAIAGHLASVKGPTLFDGENVEGYAAMAVATRTSAHQAADALRRLGNGSEASISPKAALKHLVALLSTTLQDGLSYDASYAVAAITNSVVFAQLAGAGIAAAGAKLPDPACDVVVELGGRLSSIEVHGYGNADFLTAKKNEVDAKVEGVVNELKKVLHRL